MATTMTRLEARRNIWLWSLGVLLALGAILAAALRWGGYLLIATEPLPAHVDAAVVLQGSTEGEKARVAGAMELLREGVTQHILLSIPPHVFWDEPALPAARAYLLRNYGTEAAQRVSFCEVGSNVNSTEGEAVFLHSCIRDRGWKSVAVVTSNYHSRRAGIIWRRMLRRENSTIHLSLYGVSDPEFQPHGWWHDRLYAKTWFFEFTKLVWVVFV